MRQVQARARLQAEQDESERSRFWGRRDSCARFPQKPADNADRLPLRVGGHDGVLPIGLACAAVIFERLAGTVRADG